MDHLTVELAHLLLRNQLAPDEKRRWSEHLRDCGRCERLLADERAMLRVLDLDAVPDATKGPDAQRVLDRVPQFKSATAARRRRELGLTLAAGVLVVGLAGLLAGQLARRPPGPRELAAELGISTALQDQVVANLTTLEALEQDPWVVDQLETVQALAKLITDRSDEPK